MSWGGEVGPDCYHSIGDLANAIALQDYRGNTANDEDALRVITHARLTVPHKTGPRRVCVRAVDVFGFEAEVALSVGVEGGQ